MWSGAYIPSFSPSAVVVNLAAHFCKRLKNIIFLFLVFLTSAQIYVNSTYLFINVYPSFIRNIGVHSPFSLFLCQSPSVSVKDSQMVVGILV